MATPTDSITTFSGRRCTRTKARDSQQTSTENNADTTTSSVVQETSIASSSDVVAAAALPPAATSSDDTVTSAPPAATSSLGDLNLSSSLAQAQPVIDPSTIDNPPPSLSLTQVFPTIIPAISAAPPPPSSTTDVADQTAAGLISPVRGGATMAVSSPPKGGPQAASDAGSKSVAGAVGGAVGGAMGIFFILGLIILCIRKRKNDRWSFSNWRQTASEKNRNDDSDREPFGVRARDWALDLKERAEDKFAAFSSRRRRDRDDDDDDDREKVSARNISSPTLSNSLSPRPSTSASQRSRSTSAPPEGIRDQVVASLKDWKQRIGRGRKEPVTIGRPSSPFAPQISAPTGLRRLSNPFADPSDRRATLKQGLSNQQRPPITPVRQTMLNMRSKDPFADPSGIPTSTPDFLRRKPSNPQPRGHLRKDSDPLRSNPPNWTPLVPSMQRNPSVRRNSLTNSNAGNYFLGNDANPFADPVPDIPSPFARGDTNNNTGLLSLPPSAQIRDSASSGSILLQLNRDSDNSALSSSLGATSEISTIAPLNPLNRRNGPAIGPASNSINNSSTRTSAAALALRSSTASAGTDILFGEPGPSRPTTGLSMAGLNTPFTPATPYTAGSRAFRGKSDPFDLDRPEVLGFGNVMGRKEVRASVTRMNSKHKRRSSTPGWGMPSELNGSAYGNRYEYGYGGQTTASAQGPASGPRDSRGQQPSHESKNFSMPRKPSFSGGPGGGPPGAGGRR